MATMSEQSVIDNPRLAESGAASAGPPAPQELMWRLITGFYLSQAVHVVATLGVADLQRDGPRSVDELADATGTHPRSLFRLLRALASAGVFAEDEEGRFALTAAADLLRTDVPGSFHGVARFVGSVAQWEAWGDLRYSIQTGESAFRHRFGMGLFEYQARHPDLLAAFQDAMTSFSGTESAAILAAYDFSGVRSIVDVGGGHGFLLEAILAAYPDTLGILLDLPHVADAAERRLGAAGLSGRCTVVGGDMFVSVPAGADLYILKSMLHGWEDEQAVAILRACRSAMPPDARLLVIGHVVAPGNAPDFSKLMDLNMLVVPGGRERTARELAALLGAAGLSFRRLIPTRTPFSIVEATQRCGGMSDMP
jgi:hypothetical protein